MILVVLMCLLFPAAVLTLVHYNASAARIGTVVLCYGGGLLAGNLGLVPESAAALPMRISEVAIALGLPMLLFALDVRSWTRVAGKALLSLLFACTAVMFVAATLFVLFNAQGVGRAHELAGLTVGVYTGGTPNLAAIKTGLAINESRYLVFHTFDTLIGATYLLFMMTMARALFARFLPTAAVNSPASSTVLSASANDNDDDYRPLLSRSGAINAGLAMMTSSIILGLSLALASVLNMAGNAALVICLLTGLGVAASLVSRVQNIEYSYKVGMYFIYVFSFAVAAMADFGNFNALDSTLLFIVAAVCGSLLLHALLCRLAGIDADTFMITSVACICSPSFVPMVARKLNNPTMLLSGISAGIIGYALGNFLGISLALLLQHYA
jgi:uncharacterized membrane protein